MTEADKIWEEIRDLPLEGLYGLDNQTVEDHVTRLSGLDNQLYLKLRSPAVIASLEAMISNQVTIEWKRNKSTGVKNKVSTEKFSMEEAEGYVIIKRLEADPKLKKHQANVFISKKKDTNNNPEGLVTPELTPEGSIVGNTEKALNKEGRFTIRSSEQSDIED